MVELRQQVQFKISDFDTLTSLGAGKFGDVHLCQHTQTKELYALKQLRKSRIEESNSQEEVLREKNTLKQIGQDIKGVIKYYTAVMDEESLWFVFEPCMLGSLKTLLEAKGR